MKTEWLECLVALKKYNSVAKAAESCFTTTQNFGKIIKNLEAEMGFEILSKGGRNLQLTEAAIDFATTAEKILMAINQTKHKYYNTKPKVNDKIELIVNDSDTVEFILDRFMSDFPDVSIELNEMEIMQAFQYIKSNPQTLAIVPVPKSKKIPGFQEYYEYLNFVPLCKAQTVCLVSKYSKFAGYKSIQYEDLLHEKLVVMLKSATGKNYHTEFLDDLFPQKKDISRTNSFNYFFAGISKNHFAGITISSDCNSAPYSYKNSIVSIPINSAKETVKCLVYHAKNKKFSEAEKHFVKELESFYLVKGNA